MSSINLDPPPSAESLSKIVPMPAAMAGCLKPALGAFFCAACRISNANLSTSFNMISCATWITQIFKIDAYKDKRKKRAQMITYLGGQSFELGYPNGPVHRLKDGSQRREGVQQGQKVVVALCARHNKRRAAVAV